MGYKANLRPSAASKSSVYNGVGGVINNPLKFRACQVSRSRRNSSQNFFKPSGTSKLNVIGLPLDTSKIRIFGEVLGTLMFDVFLFAWKLNAWDITALWLAYVRHFLSTLLHSYISKHSKYFFIYFHTPIYVYISDRKSSMALTHPCPVFVRH